MLSLEKNLSLEGESPALQSTQESLSDHELNKIYSQLQGYSQSRSEILKNLSKKHMAQHNIALLSETSFFESLQSNEVASGRNWVFSIASTKFSGLEYVYNVVLGPFLMKVMVLNLQRNSDDGDQQISRKELGSGGFGSVRAVQVRGQEYAIKRLAFRQQPEDYGQQSQEASHRQVRRCLKQFCMYKLCSLLDVGPRIVASSYDLICFSNCVEFRMELCSPVTSAQFFRTHQSPQQAYEELRVKMMRLHSLGIVHRDIKPENILYSPSMNEFVFGDFGMTLIIEENHPITTETKFAGTLNYCCEQMKLLYNGGQGRVNLYLNDLHCLEITNKFFGHHFTQQESDISGNAMSFSREEDSYGAELSDFNSQSTSFFNDQDRPVRTDGSYVPTTRSLLTFATSKSEAPRKGASALNSYQAQVMKKICRKAEKVHSSQEFGQKNNLMQLIRTVCEDDQTVTLIRNFVYQELPALMNTDSPQNMAKRLLPWKNASRHYGPSHPLTLEYLDKMIQQASGQDKKGLLVIKQAAVDRASCSIVDELELKILGSMRQFLQYSYCFLSLVNRYIHLSFTESVYHKKKIGLARRYLQVMSHASVPNVLAARISYAFLCFLDRLPDSNKTAAQFEAYTVQQAWQILQQEGKVRLKDKLNYYKTVDRLCLRSYDTNFSSLQYQLTSQLNLIETYSLNNQVELVFVCLNLEHSIENLSSLPLAAIINRLWKHFHEIGNKYLECTLMFAGGVNLIYKSEVDAGISILLQCQKEMQCCQYDKSLLSEVAFRTSKALGYAYYSKQEYQLSQKYSLQALQKLESEIGAYKRPQITANILNVLATCARKLHNYDQALNYRTKMAEFFESIYLNHQTFSQALNNLRGLFQLACLKYDNQDYLKRILYNLVKKYLLFILKNSPDHLHRYYPMLYVQQMNIQMQSKHRILIISYIHTLFSKFPQLQTVMRPTYQLNEFSLGKYHIMEQNRTFQGLKYLWNYIQSLTTRHKIYIENDYEIFNLFTHHLVKMKSIRRAVMFMRKYIFKIPREYWEVRQATFKKMHECLDTLGDPMKDYYRKLTKSKCKMLLNQNYERLTERESNYFVARMLEKWVKRL